MNLILCIDMRGCPNRCKHCWLGHMSNKQIGEEEAKEILDSFSRYFDRITFYSWLREPDYFDDYKNRWILDNELSTGEKPQRFELASFYKIVRDFKYVDFLKEVGTKKVQLTLFGLEELTDKYVGRKGAFREILKATNILIENGIVPRWQIFINEENKNDISEVINLADKLKEKCPDFSLFVHEGSADGENEKLYDIRIKKESVAKEIIPYYLDYDEKLSEGEIVKELLENTKEYYVPTNRNSDVVIYVANNYDVFFNFTHMHKEWAIGNLKNDDMKIICERIVNENIPALNYAKEKTVSELAKRYGNIASTKLFEKEDYKMFLLNKYVKDRTNETRES